MPLLLSFLIGGLGQAATSLVGRVLVSMGIGFVVYQGADLALGELMGMARNGLSGLPADLLGLLGVMKVDVCISILLSATAVRLSMAGIGAAGGSLKRMVMK